MINRLAAAAFVCVMFYGPLAAFPQRIRFGAAAADPWPRTANVEGAQITIDQPQIDDWTGVLLDGHAAVAIKTQASNTTSHGVIWFIARTEVDKVNRLVTLADFTLTRQDFPMLPHNGAAYAVAFQGDMPWTRVMSLGTLETALSTTSIDQAQPRVAVRNDPPRIIFSSRPAVLVSIDGNPVLRPSAEGFQKVINTRALIVADASRSTYYLALMDGWVQSSSLDGPWSIASRAPTATLDGEMPAVYVSTVPAELILTQGLPLFVPIPGTSLSYVSNSAGDIFRDNDTELNYLLIRGRWFTAPSLQDGPWTYEPATGLPAAFAKIPEPSPKAGVLVSVPGTPQARRALIANRIPQTATISRTATHATVTYAGTPEFEPVAGTGMMSAVNSPTPVIDVPGNGFYTCQAAVWFVSPSPTGPWAVATSVPVEIYSIPPSSPIYYITYVKVYGLTASSVYVGYTPGYSGRVVSADGVVVYGTGYTYRPHIGVTTWIPAPRTYGVDATSSSSAAASNIYEHWRNAVSDAAISEAAADIP